MNVNFYVCNDDKRKVNKNLSPVNSITCKIKDNCTLDNPVLIIEKDSLPNIATSNYCYISDFARYYYIHDITLMTGGRIAVKCRCDVLMSFSGSIRSLNGVIERQEHLFNDYIVDEKAPVRSERLISYHQVGSVTGSSILLTVTSG